MIFFNFRNINKNLDEKPIDENPNELINEEKDIKIEKTDEEIEQECLTKDVTIETDDEHPIARLDFLMNSFEKNIEILLRIFRPRRLSELNIVEKVKQIPPYSSLFLFKHTNKYL